MVTIEQMMKVTVLIIRSCCMLLRIGMWLLLWASPHRYKIIMVDKHIIYIQYIPLQLKHPERVVFFCPFTEPFEVDTSLSSS